MQATKELGASNAHVVVVSVVRDRASGVAAAEQARKKTTEPGWRAPEYYQESLSRIEAINGRVAELKKRDELSAAVEVKEEESETLTATLTGIEIERAEAYTHYRL